MDLMAANKSNEHILKRSPLGMSSGNDFHGRYNRKLCMFKSLGVRQLNVWCGLDYSTSMPGLLGGR